MVLTQVMEVPGIGRAELPRALQVTPQAADDLVTRLVDKKLLERTERRPGRPIALTLTPPGSDLVSRIAPQVEGMAREILLWCFRTGDTAHSFDGASRRALGRLAREPEWSREVVWVVVGSGRGRSPGDANGTNAHHNR